MSDGTALLRAILISPAEDTPRLALADYLDETGEPERAEFIRLQIDHAHHWPKHVLTPGCRCAGCRRWRQVQRVLTPERHEEWCGPVYAPSTRVRWYRGFVETIELPCADFLAHAAAIFAAHPVRKVVLTDKHPRPSPVDMHTDETDGFYWQADSNVRSLRASGIPVVESEMHLPGAVFELLTEGTCDRRYTPFNREYTTAELALSDLSDACVAHGRNLAGLPALPEPVTS